MVRVVDYDGYVYCAEVPTHAIVVRRNGKPFISGNSCTAFGTIGAWEALIRVARNDPGFTFDLSERDLFACSGGTCDSGNTMEAVLDKAKEGICLEACCPYDGADHSCGEGRCKGGSFFKIKGWRAITDIEEMRELLKRGPLVGTMTVHQSFFNYLSGVYHSLGILDFVAGYHCIGIFGEDEVLEAWLLRNSWGTDWGLDGYALIAYGDSDIDQTMYLIEPEPEPQPEPEPEPEKSFWDWLWELIEKWWPF